MTPSPHGSKNLFPRIIRIIIAVTGGLATSSASLRAEDIICVPVAAGVPGDPGPPNWWLNFPGGFRRFSTDVDDPRWNGAARFEFGAPPRVTFRALHAGRVTHDSVYLSWHVRADPEASVEDILYVGFIPRSGVPTIIRFEPFDSGRIGPTSEFANHSPRISVWRWSVHDDVWMPHLSWPMDMNWLAETGVWGNNRAGTWGVQMMIPIYERPDWGLDLAGTSRMWFEVRNQTPGGLVSYRWPSTTAYVGGVSRVPIFSPINPSWGGAFSMIGAGPLPARCGGVSITWQDIGTTNTPNSAIEFTRPPAINNRTNRFWASPTNNTSREIRAGEVSARFRIANWGSIPDGDVGLWQDITPLAPIPLPSNRRAIPNDGMPAGPDARIEFEWPPLDLCTRYDYIPDDYPPECAGREKRSGHQCMLVELHGDGIPFTNSTAYRNMDFVTASRFTRQAEISVRGLTPIPGGGPWRTVYLYVETHNMPARVTASGRPPSEPRSTLGSPNNLERMGSVSRQEAVARDTLADLPTYIVHVYHETGDSVATDAGRFPRLEPQSSFGYFVAHEGGLEGWRTRLIGATEIAPNFFQIDVPNGGVAHVTTIIETLEPGGLTGSIVLSASATRSTVDAEKLGAEALFVHERHPDDLSPRHQRTRLSLGANYDGKKKETAAAVITRSYIGHAQHLVYLPGGRFFVSGNARYLHNNSLGVYLQQSYSLLLGTLIQAPTVSMEVDVGPAYVGQNFMGSQASTGFPAVALEELLTFDLGFIRPGTTVSEAVRVALPVQSGDPWIGVGELALFVPITPRISLTAAAFDYYLSNPPSGFERNYFNVTAGLSIPFGRAQ